MCLPNLSGHWIESCNALRHLTDRRSTYMMAYDVETQAVPYSLGGQEATPARLVDMHQMFAQWWNCLTTYFSECISIVKWHTIEYLKSLGKTLSPPLDLILHFYLSKYSAKIKHLICPINTQHLLWTELTSPPSFLSVTLILAPKYS